MPKSAEATVRHINRLDLGSLSLLIAALFAVGWIIARDCIQSITIDEADTYVYFVGGKIYSQWQPHSNNHLLNTLLIHLFTTVFGLHHLTMRMPSLIGALVYIGSVFQLCRMLFRERLLGLLVFLSLVYNPFLMDFFVAARGYSLALGFLFLAILIFCRIFMKGPAAGNVLASAAFASVCLGVSFTSNFSFAFVDFASMMLFLVLAWELGKAGSVNRAGSQSPPSDSSSSLRIGTLALACILPGAVWAFLVAGWTILKWPKGQLVYGSLSLLEMWRGIIQSCFFEMNSQLLNPMLFRWFARLSKYLPYLTALLILLVFLQIVADVWRSKAASRILSNRLLLVELYLAAVLLITLCMHWFAFHAFGLLLPRDRTGIFFVPLTTLLIGISCIMYGRTTLESAVRQVRIGLVCVGVLSFIACMRLSYFEEWKYDADIKGAYEALVKAVGSGKYLEVPCQYLFTSALNFYREYYHDNSFQYFYLTFRSEYKPGKRAYVLLLPQDQGFLDQQHLKTVFHGKNTDLIVAVRATP